MKMSWSARSEGKEPNNLPESDYEYDGEWKANLYEGRGVMKYANGDLYDGEWKNDLKEGRGVYRWGNGKFKGDVYDGEWKDDLKEGRGVYKCASGEVYEGAWNAGKRKR